MAGCVFCQVLSGDIPAELVHDDDVCIAFRDIQPQAPVHVLVVPREHLARISDMAPEHEALVGHLFQVAAQVARQEGISEAGYRLVINCGPHGQQAVDHLHVHVLGGRQMTWPPG
jgi:histidine triad (HIT) family protein